MANTVYFFGYGANRDYYKLKEILGKEPKGGKGAILEGFDLAYQTLDQIPEVPRSFLQKVWGDIFRSYTLKKGTGCVSGVVWELEPEDVEKLKEWEFVGKWREIVSVPVKTSDGRTIQALTEKAQDLLPTKEIVDGLNYENNLNNFKKRDTEADEYRLKELSELRKEISAVSKVA